jgi:ubiquinone/menaquinone biosynthesis C-methylase UbiE/DNA-binding transcriptional ArsR family regulator
MNDEQHSIILKSIADETRLRLIRLLSKEELNVQEICDILQLPQPRVSRHLATLKQINLVKDRRDGTRAYYSLCHLTGILADFKAYIDSICESNHADLIRLENSLKKRTEFSREFAGNMAEHWDEISAGLHSPLASMFSMAGLAPRGLTVADLGCGTGIMLPLMSRFASSVYAVDHSEEMLEKAKRRCEQLEISNVNYISSDFNSLKDKISDCDALLLHFVLHQAASPQTIIKALLPVLKPGGRIVIVDQQKHDDENAREKYGSIWLGFEEEQLCGWLDNAGFSESEWLILDDDSTQGVFVASATKN